MTMRHSDRIRYLDFEISSLCNANCPVCVRTNENGKFSNFKQTYWTLDEVKRVLDKKLIKQLYGIILCGNFGDPMGNPQVADIIEYISEINPTVKFDISTNGGIGNKKLYERIGKYNVNLILGIDGVGKKNELHRVNVKWDKVLENVYAFLSNVDNKNLYLEVQYILWEENKDQLPLIIDFVKSLGMGKLYIRDPYGGDKNNVFDKKGNFTHVLNKLNRNDNLSQFLETHWNYDQLLELKQKVSQINIDTPTIITDDFIEFELDNTVYEVKKVHISDEDYEKKKNELVRIKEQTCFSLNNITPSNLNKSNYNVFISHDKTIMPCCYIPPHLYEFKNGFQQADSVDDIFQAQLLNKMIDIGFDKFSVKDKTLREVFDSGVLHNFVYDDLRSDNASLFCKEMCGKCF